MRSLASRPASRILPQVLELALANITDESFNTADGFQTLHFNRTGGHNNVATGWRALFRNTTGLRKVANGASALYNNTTGELNTAVGDQALFSNIGPGAGFVLNGGDNTAVGWATFFSNTTGHDNTAIGLAMLGANKTGFLNTALGSVAGSLTTGDNNINIGNQGVAEESNTIRIGTEVAVPDVFGFTLPPQRHFYRRDQWSSCPGWRSGLRECRRQTRDASILGAI